MTFFRIKKVGSRDYVYEMRSFRNLDGEPRNEIVRYVGPVEPTVRRAHVDIAQLRKAGGVADGKGESPAGRRDRKTTEREQRRARSAVPKGRSP